MNDTAQPDDLMHANPDQSQPEPTEMMEPLPPPSLPPREVSLELTLDPSAGTRFWRARALAPMRAGRTRQTALRMTWHDTPDASLARAGEALVCLQEPRATVWQRQVLRRDGSVIWPLGTPPLLRATEPEAETLPVVAVLEGVRRRLALAAGSGLSECALLEGELSVAASRHKVAQLNLRGEPEAVFAVTRALLEELPLTVTQAGLSGTVRQLLIPPGVTIGAPKPPELDRSLDIDEAFAHVVSQLAATILHHAPAARLGQGPEPVHQMRVALRRLRSALSLFRKVTGGQELDRARADLATLARALGPARDLDVFLAGIGRDVAKALPGEAAIARMNAAARRRRRAAYDALNELLAGKQFQHLLLDLVELSLGRPWRTQATPDRPQLVAFAERALDRKLRQATEAGDDLAPLPDAELHAVRIRCKRLRYAAELFVPLAPAKHSRRFLRRLASVQERLGQLNDGAVASGLLSELGQRGMAAGMVRGYLAARTSGGRAKAERSWRKFRRTEPFWK